VRPVHRRGLAAALLLIAATGAAWGLVGRDRLGVPPELRAVLLRDPARVGAVRLVDHRGRAVTSDELFTGGWSFVFLGFAGCPNVCPATLAQLAAVKRSLARQSPGTPQPRYVFVSVDPQRDTPARLAGYVAAFDRDFVGATGEPAQVAALSDALTAFHRLEAPNGAGDYGVVHSGEVYLLDPAGRVYARFTPPLMARQAAGRS
jgi:protein SCO1/2